MSLHPLITRDSKGVLWLSIHPDAPVDGYRVYDSAGAPVARTLDPTHVTRLGAVASWSGSVAGLHLAEDTPEPVAYPPPAPPPPPPAPSIPPYGVSIGGRSLVRPDADKDFELDQIQAVGARVVRFDATPGGEQQVDVEIAKAQARGLAPFLILYGVAKPVPDPSWAAKAAARWKGKACGYEIANEPDIHGWTPDQYADWLQAVAARIRSVDPATPIVAACHWKGANGHACLDFAAACISRAKGSFTHVGMHLYDDPDDHGSWSIWEMAYPWPAGHYNGRTVREQLDAAGLHEVPIISTESGGPTPKYSLAKMAQIAEHGLREVKAGKIAGYYYYTMLDDDVPGFGMLDPARQQRPVWAAYQAATTN